MTATVIIPVRFRDEVLQHLFLNYVNLAGQPLILGVFGFPGEGKTFQLRTLLRDHGVEVFSINAADLESAHAGVPGKLVIEQYVAAAHRLSDGTPSALVIDDVDTTIGEWSQNTGTVNHQQVLAQLMHLADHPQHIEKIGVIRRVPVFVTGNDPTKLYAPLRRPGRMSFLYWKPSTAEREAIVQAIYADVLLEHQAIRLAKLYEHRPISFFAQLRSALVRSVASSVINKSATNLIDVAKAPDKYAGFVLATMRSLGADAMVRLEALARKADENLESASHSYLT